MYRIAVRGGKNHGLLEHLRGQTDEQLERSINSFISNIDEHRMKLSAPSNYIYDWDERSEQYKNGVIKKWQKDIQRNMDQLDVALGVANERREQYER